jgi:polysaccharide biosynthesis protein PslH
MTLKILFITKAYPYPAQTGDLRYTAGLIESLSRFPLVNVTVFCGAGLPASLPAETVLWRGQEWQPNFMTDIGSIFSRYPRGAARAYGPGAKRNLEKLLTKNTFDLALINEAVCAKAVPIITKFKIPALYISHNVESDIRPRIAAQISGVLRRWLQRLDAQKYCRMELDLLQKVTGLSAITEEDRARYAQLAPNLRSIILKPGYSKDEEILPMSDAPRAARAVLIGSFEWGAKRLNLERILKAYRQFSKLNGGGFPLRIAGKMPPAFLDQLRKSYPEVEFFGSFDRLSEVVQDANVALVLEDLGGGFKLKTLDYIFNGLAIVGLPKAMTGSGLVAHQEYLAVNSIEAAMPAIASLIKDQSRVKRLATLAHLKADGQFHWSERGVKLLEFIQELLKADSTSCASPGNPTNTRAKIDIDGV